MIDEALIGVEVANTSLRIDLLNGMSLRDYFAGQVLMGMHLRLDYDPGLRTPEQRASLAYIDADAMLRERAKQP